MRFIALLIALPALALLSGCARSRITTEIRPDGTWKRTDVFTGQEKKEGVQMGGTLEETFVLPRGAGWKASEETKNGERTATYERVLGAGRPVAGDLSLKESADSAKPLLTNEAVVKRVAPGRFEYRETLHWRGAAPEGLDIKPAELAEIQASLPKPLATPENAKALAGRSAALFIPLLFGPGDPLLAMGLLHPDLAARRASQRIGSALLQALEEQFGDRLTAEERRRVARKLIEQSFSSRRPTPPDASSGPPASKGSLTPLMFVVKAPGRVVSSNGETDDLTGEVYWALYPEAATLKDVVLSAVFEMPGK